MKKTFKKRRKYSRSKYTKGPGKNTKQLLAQGKKYLKKGDMDNAALTFEKCFKENSRNSECMSYYGLLSALRWGKVGLGIDLCTKALKTNTINPDFYLNLAKVYEYANNKPTAGAVLRKGLFVAPSNKHINSMLYKIGARKRPYIPFLKWSNSLNRGLDIFFKHTIPSLFKKRMPQKLRKRMEAQTAKA